MTKRNGFLALACVLSAACWAQAAVTDVKFAQVDKGAVLPGFVTNDILIDFTGNVRAQAILLELSQGSIFQHDDPLVPGSPNRVAPAGAFLGGPLDPNGTLAYDTFVTLGGPSLPVAGTPFTSSASFVFPGGAVDIPGGSAAGAWSTSKLDFSWAPGTGMNHGPGSDFLVARVTLSDDAEGTLHFLGTTEGQVAADWFRMNDIPILNGVIGADDEPGDAVLSVLFGGAAVGATVDLGIVQPNQPLVATFEISNTGEAGSILNITSFDVSGDFSLVGDFPNDILAGTSANFQVQADDTSMIGLLSGMVNINSNGGSVEFGLTAWVPEPSSLALLGLAMFGIVGFAGRRR